MFEPSVAVPPGVDADGPVWTVHALLEAYRRREVSPVEVIDQQLGLIDRVEPAVNAFVSVHADEARAAALASAERWVAGRPMGDLDGVPVSVKDIVAMAGYPTSEGSTTGSPVPSTEDTPSVARLREAGAVFLGKTTTSEFGWKGMTDTPRFGVTRNPWNLDHTPGGSSGGAGASMAAGIGAVAHGTDGGGSVRLPSSYCGLVGLKPTFGRVPQTPTESTFTTLVSTGPLARSVEDAALLLNVFSRPDVRDWNSVPHDPRDWRVGLHDGLGGHHGGGLRIAFTDTLGGAATDPAVSAVCRSAIAALEAGGHQVSEAGTVFDPLRPQLEDYWKAGFAARLRSIPSDQWSDLDPGFRQLAQEGLAIDAAGVQAGHAARARLATRMRRFHEAYDVLLTPTMPTVAPPVDTVYHSAEFDRWSDAVPFTVPFNYTGQPAVSIPVGTVATAGGALPVGLQVVATHYREDLVLRVARVILDLLR